MLYIHLYLYPPWRLEKPHLRNTYPPPRSPKSCNQEPQRQGKAGQAQASEKNEVPWLWFNISEVLFALIFKKGFTALELPTSGSPPANPKGFCRSRRPLVIKRLQAIALSENGPRTEATPPRLISIFALKACCLLSALFAIRQHSTSRHKRANGTGFSIRDKPPWPPVDVRNKARL